MSAGDVEFTAGFVNSVVLGEALGGSGTLVYSVRVDDGTATGGDLPLVLSFDASSRTLSSTVDLAVSPASYSLLYKVTDANGASDTAEFTVMVNAAVSVPAVADVEFTAGFADSVVLGEASGGSGTLVYSVRVDDGTATGGDLPSVLSFYASSRALWSTAVVAAGSHTLRLTVTDANGASDSADFAVTVKAFVGGSEGDGRWRGLISVPSPHDLVWTEDDLDPPVFTEADTSTPTTVDSIKRSEALPEASGGAEPQKYALTLSDGSALPQGFEFDPSSRTLTISARVFSDMPAIEASSYSLRYTVTDARLASASKHFVVTLVSTIPDVDRDAPYRQAVVWMVANGITEGCSQDRFCPDGQLKRSHAVTFLWRAVGRPAPPHAGSDAFSDVEEDSYADSAIGWALATGLTQGCTPGQPGDPHWRFCPADTLNRAQTAAFLYRLVQVDPPSPLQLKYPDVDPGSYYAKPAAWLHVNDIMAPCAGGGFCPYQIPSRADFANYMYRIAATPSSWATDRAPLPQLAVANSD